MKLSDFGAFFLYLGRVLVVTKDFAALSLFPNPHLTAALS
jgi:hypothetical protein